MQHRGCLGLHQDFALRVKGESLHSAIVDARQEHLVLEHPNDDLDMLLLEVDLDHVVVEFHT